MANRKKVNFSSEELTESEKKKQSLSVPPPVAPSSDLQHMSYGCPGLTGAGSQMDIKPMNFHDLLQSLAPSCERILIPLLQRTYCWTDTQINQWWKDATGVTRSSQSNYGDMYGHRTGKCIFKSNRIGSGETFELICIDGQQRITTQLLLITAIRDAALKICRLSGKLQKEDCDIVQSDLVVLIDGLEKLLFPNPDAMKQWISGQVTSIGCMQSPCQPGQPSTQPADSPPGHPPDDEHCGHYACPLGPQNTSTQDNNSMSRCNCSSLADALTGTILLLLYCILYCV